MSYRDYFYSLLPTRSPFPFRFLPLSDRSFGCLRLEIISLTPAPLGLPEGNRMPKAPPLLPLAQWSCRQILCFRAFLFFWSARSLLGLSSLSSSGFSREFVRPDIRGSTSFVRIVRMLFQNGERECFVWGNRGDWGSGGELTTALGGLAFLFSVKTVRCRRKTVICTPHFHETPESV